MGELAFKESWLAGRDVTLNAGGGDRCRIGVGTIGVGSVRSYAAAGFGEDDEKLLGFVCACTRACTFVRNGGSFPPTLAPLALELVLTLVLIVRFSRRPSGAVWLRVGTGRRPRGTAVSSDAFACARSVILESTDRRSRGCASANFSTDRPPALLCAIAARRSCTLGLPECEGGLTDERGGTSLSNRSRFRVCLSFSGGVGIFSFIVVSSFALAFSFSLSFLGELG